MLQKTGQRFQGFSGSTLKIIALITMIIDHIGASIVYRLPGFSDRSTHIYTIYRTMRLIGRLAFPIYCFLLVEGLIHTHNQAKYVLRMFIFCLLSEIPFDLAFSISFYDFGHQNVFWTLFMGLLLLCFWEYINAKEHMSIYLQALIYASSLGFVMLIAYLTKVDYKAAGILTIAVMYLCRQIPVTGCATGCSVLTLMSSSSEITSFAVLPLIYFYNGTRGLRLKYFFYIAYPAHLLLLYLIEKLMGFI